MDMPPLEPSAPECTKEYWTDERRHEHRIKGAAHELCKAGRWEEAKTLCVSNNVHYPPFPSSPQQPGTIRPSEKLKAAARENGKLGGCPTGTTNGAGTKIILSRPQDTEHLIDHMAFALLEGKGGIKMSPGLRELSENDRAILQRVAKISAEEMNERLTEKLSDFADKVLDRMAEKLEKDQFNPSQLSFALAVAMDKRGHLLGQNAIKAANINLQVNNFGTTRSREDMIKSLTGEVDVTPAQKTA